MAFLLDTVTVSEAGKRNADPSVVAWYKSKIGGELFISVLTIGEIRRGIAQRRRRDPKAADRLEQWLAVQRAFFADRILPVDEAVAECWGKLSPAMTLPVVDGLLAATAIVHGLTVATRNTRDFLLAGVSLVNPWDSAA
jgi:predicted nucleic acid-binding protein